MSSLSFIVNSTFFIINTIRMFDASFNGHKFHLYLLYKIVVNLGALRIRQPIYYYSSPIPFRQETLEFVDEDVVD